MKGGIDCSLNILGVDCDQYCFYLVWCPSLDKLILNCIKVIQKLIYISNLVNEALRPDTEWPLLEVLVM